MTTQKLNRTQLLTKITDTLQFVKGHPRVMIYDRYKKRSFDKLSMEQLEDFLSFLEEKFVDYFKNKIQADLYEYLKQEKKPTVDVVRQTIEDTLYKNKIFNTQVETKVVGTKIEISVKQTAIRFIEISAEVK